MKWTIGTKLQLLVATFTIGTIAIVGGTIALLDAKKGDALQINLAGRQRMLSQRMTKEALTLATAPNDAQRSTAAAALAQTVELFDKTLQALAHGGTTTGADGKPVTLPGAPAGPVQDALTQGAALWSSLVPGLRALASGDAPVDGSPGQAALAALQAQNLELLKRMNTATLAFQSASVGKLGTLYLFQGLALGFVLLLAAWAIWAIRRQILRPLREIGARFCHVAEGGGDLGERVPEHDRDELGQLGRSFNLFMAKLRDTISDVKDSAKHLSGSSREISASADALSQASSGQAASLQEVRAALSEVEERNRSNSQSVREASEFSQEANQDATSGQAHVVRMTEVMAEIKSSSEEITRVIQVIDEIAFQTNLLALNAAVEAARAGEAGKGFAVVADEVRSLAHRSAEAARSSGEMIQSAVSRAEQGNGVAQQVSEVFGRICEGSDRMQALLGRITESDASLAQGMDQISAGLADLDGQAQTTAAQSEELSAASRVGDEQVHKLLDLVERFEGRRETSPAKGAASPASPSGTGSARTLPAPDAAKSLAKPAAAQPEAPKKPDAKKPDAKNAAAKPPVAKKPEAKKANAPQPSEAKQASQPARALSAKPLTKPSQATPPKAAPSAPAKPSVDKAPSLAAPVQPAPASTAKAAPSPKAAKPVDQFLPFDDDDDDDDWVSF